MDLKTDPETSSLASESLESKIHNFLQGNSAFNAFDLGFHVHSAQGVDNLSPITGADTQDGTPVRDEGGGTPTQDEVMDKPLVGPFPGNTNQTSVGKTFDAALTAYQTGAQQNLKNPQPQAHLQPGLTQNGQLNQQYPHSKHDASGQAITAPVGHYQPIPAQMGGAVPGEGALGGASGTQTAKRFPNERGWYDDIYPKGNSQQLVGYNVSTSGGAEENEPGGLYSYHPQQTQQPQELASQQSTTATPGYFRSNLPPVPNFPPPHHTFENAPHTPSGAIIPQEQHLHTNPEEVMGPRVDSVISGMVVHDHQHKSMFRPEDPPYDFDRPHPPHPDSLHYQEEPEHYHQELRHPEAQFFQDDQYHHPEGPYHRPGSPPHHYPRVRGRLTPPVSPSEEPYFAHDYQRHRPPPPRFALRRPPPPHPEIRHLGLRPPPRPPHPAHLPLPRGPPRPPFPRFHGPDPRMRGKRPGPRGGGNPGPMFAPKRPFLPPRYWLFT